YGQVLLAQGGRFRQFTDVSTPSAAGYTAHQIDLARRTLILDDDSNQQNHALFENVPVFHPTPGFSISNYFRGGDTITNLTGVLHWSFAGLAGTDAWRIRPVTESFSYGFTAVNTRSTVPDSVGGTLKVASFNVLNYFTTLGSRGANSTAELDRQAAKIVAAFAGLDADVIGVMEIENNNDIAIADLVSRLNAAAGAGTYAYIPTGVVGTDEITVGIIYKPARVTPVGAVQILTDAAFTDPNGTGTQRNRPAVAQTFADTTGERFTIVVNHLKSKGSCPSSGSDTDQGDGQACWNATRQQGVAYMVGTWLPALAANVGDSDFLVVGDMNAYRNEDPITNFTGAGYIDLFDTLFGASAYGYVFDGQLGYLDHALVSPSLMAQVSGASQWHINADEVNLLDYNDTIRDDGEANYDPKPAALPLYEPNAYRSSDHDPVLVGLNLASYSFDVVINEVDYDQPGTDNAEFIELKNVSNTAVDLSEYTVQLVNGNGNVVYDTIVLPAVTLPAGAYYVLCATNALVTNCDLPDAFASIQNGAPDGIALRQNGILVDALAYEGSIPGLTETSPAPADPDVIGQGLSRYPDGVDTNDNSADFSVHCITPGIANSSQTSTCTVEFAEVCSFSTGIATPVGTTNPIMVNFADLGDPAVDCVRVMYFGYDHPNASTALQTGGYWHIEATPADAGSTTAFTYSLTLPFANPVYPDDKICRWLEGTGPGYGWDCAAGAPGGYTATDLTRSGLHGFSDWAVGDYAGPTAVSIQSLSAQTSTPFIVWSLPLFVLMAGLIWWRIATRKQRES
ncbi:MAG: ExeM/NucH family extracellular endonuclease, partial [Anaerolineales bacterium]|nr:ExeM/NucH family extracellular endonuclease [Anaerolineales bacterium]